MKYILIFVHIMIWINIYIYVCEGIFKITFMTNLVVVLIQKRENMTLKPTA